MKSVFAFSSVLLVIAACSSFDAGDDGTKSSLDAGRDGNVVDTADATAADANVPVGPLVCPTGSLLCEQFDTSLDTQKWTKWDANDLACTTEPLDGRGRVLVSVVSGATTVDDQGARIIYDLKSKVPIVIELDMKVEQPKLNPGGSADNFSVLTLGTDNINVTFYVTKDGLIQFNSSVKNEGGDGFTPHSIENPHVTFGQWAHYIIKANLGTNTTLELSRDKTVLASGERTTGGQLDEFLSLGVARNNDFYDLHAEYDNVVVYPQ